MQKLHLSEWCENCKTKICLEKGLNNTRTREAKKAESVILTGILWFLKMWKFIRETYGEVKEDNKIKLPMLRDRGRNWQEASTVQIYQTTF